MSWQKFGFFAGFLFVALWALAGIGPAIGALVMGAAGFYVGRVLDGKAKVDDLVDRITASSSSH